MRKIFQKRRRIKDIFISNRLNFRNKRFGFVKFHEVVNSTGKQVESYMDWDVVNIEA